MRPYSKITSYMASPKGRSPCYPKAAPNNSSSIDIWSPSWTSPTKSFAKDLQQRLQSIMVKQLIDDQVHFLNLEYILDNILLTYDPCNGQRKLTIHDATFLNLDLNIQQDGVRFHVWSHGQARRASLLVVGPTWVTNQCFHWVPNLVTLPHMCLGVT